MGMKKIKDIPWHIHTVESTYDDSLDDYMLDKCEPTQMIIKLSKKTSSEQIMNEMKLNRKAHIAHISTKEIYIVKKSNNEPVYCLKKVEA